MDPMTAYCGLDCRTCLVHQATVQENGEDRARMRDDIARLCREQYGIQYKREDIADCCGCRAEPARMLPGCRNCRIRNCAQAKEIESCAYCGDYACGELEDIFSREPSARKRLDRLRKNIQ